MHLILDIGNSNVTIGFFDENVLLNVVSFSYSRSFKQNIFEQILEQLLSDKNFTECILASVASDMTQIISDAVTSVCNVRPIEINHDMKFGFKIKAKKPRRIGIDRIANICAAGQIYSEHVIVVDFGTATTFDIMDDEKSFIGGLIMPGIGTQLKSLTENTSDLPKVELSELEKVKSTINTDTVKAMLSGIVKGHAYAVEGLLTDCIKELKTKPVIIATGGHALLMQNYMKKYKFDTILPDLTLKGLQRIYELNSD